MAKTQKSNIQMQATDANRVWAKTIGDILASTADPLCLQRLGQSHNHPQPDAGVDYDEIAAFAVRCTVMTATVRAWSMGNESEIPPNYFAGILDTDIGLVQDKLQLMRSDLETIADMMFCAAYDGDDPCRKAFKRLLKDLAKSLKKHL